MKLNRIILIILQVTFIAADFESSKKNKRVRRSGVFSSNSTFIAEDRQLDMASLFPRGSIFSLFFEVAIHVFDYTSTISQNILLDIPITYAIPSGNGRGQDTVTTVNHLLSGVEDKINRFGMDGRSCVKRLVCEINARPVKGGLLGDIINTIFMGDLEDGDKEYYWAQERGRRKRDCFIYTKSCPVSFFNLQNMFDLGTNLIK